jgi:hypothetical protein
VWAWLASGVGQAENLAIKGAQIRHFNCRWLTLPYSRRVAPQWAKTLVMTDWVSLLCMPPIIAGLVVFMVYLAQVTCQPPCVPRVNGASGVYWLYTAEHAGLCVSKSAVAAYLPALLVTGPACHRPLILSPSRPKASSRTCWT